MMSELHQRQQPLVIFDNADFERIKAMPKDAAEILRAANASATYLDLSFELGIPLGTVKSRLHRARQRLEKLRAADRQKETTP